MDVAACRTRAMLQRRGPARTRCGGRQQHFQQSACPTCGHRAPRGGRRARKRTDAGDRRDPMMTAMAAPAAGKQSAAAGARTATAGSGSGRRLGGGRRVSGGMSGSGAAAASASGRQGAAGTTEGGEMALDYAAGQILDPHDGVGGPEGTQCSAVNPSPYFSAVNGP